jgi:hypothetical protein
MDVQLRNLVWRKYHYLIPEVGHGNVTIMSDVVQYHYLIPEDMLIQPLHLVLWKCQYKLFKIVLWVCDCYIWCMEKNANT